MGRFWGGSGKVFGQLLERFGKVVWGSFGDALECFLEGFWMFWGKFSGALWKVQKHVFNTVDTFDKTWHFLVREFWYILELLSGFWPGF